MTRPKEPNNAGRSTTGGPMVPEYLEAPWREAAKHLRLTVTRYLADRVLFRDVEEAMEMLRREVAEKDAARR